MISTAVGTLETGPARIAGAEWDGIGRTIRGKVRPVEARNCHCTRERTLASFRTYGYLLDTHGCQALTDG